MPSRGPTRRRPARSLSGSGDPTPRYCSGRDSIQCNGCGAPRSCASAAAERSDANIRAIVALALHSRAVLKRLRQELALEYECVERGILHFYTDPDEFQASLAPAALMRELGCNRRQLTPEEAVDIEPALASIADRLAGADYCAEDESGDAHMFTRALAQRCGERGVRFLFDTTVKSVSVEDGRARSVSLVDTAGRQSREAADAVVVCLGVESAARAAAAGSETVDLSGQGLLGDVSRDRCGRRAERQPD